uniref:CCHC-type domain-containing protein n=1 Tax=Papio anubis TaxID=9555 RepID=A0A8I5NVQ5_PAPAN
MAQVLLVKTQPSAPTPQAEEDSTSISDEADGGPPPSRPTNPPPYAPPTAPPSATPLTSPISAHTRSKTMVAAPTSQPSTSQPAPTPSTSQPASTPSTGQLVSTYPTGQSVSTSPVSLLAPFQEVAGAEGLVRVHVPFSLADLSKIEKWLGDFSANPTLYSKEFRYLCQAYDLTWHDLQVILSSSLNPEERECILAAARQHADQWHLTDTTVPLGEMAVPSIEPDWDYQPQQPGRHRRDIMVQCLLAGMQAASNKVVNFDKLKEIIQHSDENPASFLNRLTEALAQFTRLDPTSPAGAAVLASYFISQSASDIQKKLKKVEDGPQTPIQDLVKLAFKVFNSREAAAEAAELDKEKRRAVLQAQALLAALQPALPTLPAGKTQGKSPKGACFRCGDPKHWADKCPQTKGNLPSNPCFKCGTTGHWASKCPNPRSPTAPCPVCHQEAHWKSDCPAVRTGPAPQHGASPQRSEGSFQLLHLDDD